MVEGEVYGGEEEKKGGGGRKWRGGSSDRDEAGSHRNAINSDIFSTRFFIDVYRENAGRLAIVHFH